MRTIKRNHQKNPAVITAIIIALLLAGLAVYVFAFKGPFFGFNAPVLQEADQSPNKSDETINEEPSTDEQIDAGKDIKKGTVDNSDSTPLSPEDPVNARVSASDKGNGVVGITATIERSTNKGTCTVTLTSGSKTKTESAGVQALSNYSACKFPDIEGLSAGTWKINLQYKNGPTEGSASTSITL